MWFMNVFYFTHKVDIKKFKVYCFEKLEVIVGELMSLWDHKQL